MNDAELRERLAVQGQRFALETFSVEKYGGHFNQIIRELRGRPGASLEELTPAIMEMTDQSFLELIKNWKISHSEN